MGNAHGQPEHHRKPSGGGHGGHDGFTFGNEKIQGISNRETSPYEPVSFCQKLRENETIYKISEVDFT